MRLAPLSLALLAQLAAGGCLMEYVLPSGASTDGSTGATGTDVTGATGDAPTGGSGTAGGSGTDGASGGQEGSGSEDDGEDGDEAAGCDEVCNADEQCIAGECRDVFDLDCAACPCPAQCPEGSGLLGASGESGTGGGGESGVYLCCDGEDGPVCVSGSQGDVLTCPEDP